MTERIDHAAEARKTLDHTLSYCETDDNTEALVNVSAAQVHATLALVEQQRIANLLILSGWMQDASKEDIGYDLDNLRTGVAGEVWEGLGL